MAQIADDFTAALALLEQEIKADPGLAEVLASEPPEALSLDFAEDDVAPRKGAPLMGAKAKSGVHFRLKLVLIQLVLPQPELKKILEAADVGSALINFLAAAAGLAVATEAAVFAAVAGAIGVTAGVAAALIAVLAAYIALNIIVIRAMDRGKGVFLSVPITGPYVPVPWRI